MDDEVLTLLVMKDCKVNMLVDGSDFNTPLGPLEPYEVANIIASLLSNVTKTITGTSIVINGSAIV